MYILEVDQLSKSYNGKELALRNCDFKLKKGTICAVVGESGGGKSTLLRLIAGLEHPSSGIIKINGKIASNDTKITPPQKRQAGMVFQDFALFPHLTVFENIAFGLKTNKKATAAHFLNLVQMEAFTDAYPHTLSGGQAQRVAIARTLALKPQLLLLDEPFSSLDYDLKSMLRSDIHSLTKSLKTSMLFITHDISDAIAIADEIIFLKNGHLIWHGSISELSNDIKNDPIKTSISLLRKNAKHILKHTKPQS